VILNPAKSIIILFPPNGGLVFSDNAADTFSNGLNKSSLPDLGVFEIRVLSFLQTLANAMIMADYLE